MVQEVGVCALGGATGASVGAAAGAALAAGSAGAGAVLPHCLPISIPIRKSRMHSKTTHKAAMVTMRDVIVKTYWVMESSL